jgi:hypothetical protein
MNIMRLIHVAGLSLWFAVIGAQAQSTGKTDTGGGMGGTGNQPVRELMADIGAELRPMCERARAIGDGTRRSVKNLLSKTLEPVCVGQTLKTSQDETLIIDFNKSGRLEISEGATLSVEQAIVDQNQFLVLLQSGEFLITQTSESIRYAVKARNPVELNLGGNKRLLLSLKRTAVELDLFSLEVLVWPGGPEPIVFTLGSQTITAEAGQETFIEMRPDGTLRLK